GNPLTSTTMMEAEFISIRAEFVSATQIFMSESILNALKEHYAAYIDSNRKLSQIKDLNTLLKVLEKRDILSCVNIEPLLYISNNFLNDLPIQKKINNYKIYLETVQYSPFYNMYQDVDEDKHENNSVLLNASGTSQIKILNESLPKYKDHKTNYFEDEIALQQILLSNISEKIGRSWRDTVRYLGLPEYQIDAIENNYAFNLKEQSYQALKLCMSQNKSGNWKINLIQALEKARRRDLKELAEKLIIGFKQ
ncbi:Death domain-containing adapter protein BG4, partial [Habropoda laboriosa]